jgi:tRNA modification GTPase
MSLDDTIVAISTPVGEGGIGIVRLSGSKAVTLAGRVFRSAKGKDLSVVKSHTIHYGAVVDPVTDEPVDEVLITVMRAPRTYTREDVIEINCHGGIIPLRTILRILIREGARLAEPGEFTKRAFLSGRIDLSQAEAVIDVIQAKTNHAERLALRQLEGRLSDKIHGIRERVAELCARVEAYIDFPEEEVEGVEGERMALAIGDVAEQLSALSRGYDEGRLFREGVAAAIVGKPNVGKSSLLNALLDADRAIVTEIPGTTRDVIEEYLTIGGIPVKIMDTAGIRETHDLAEMEGVRRSLRALAHADIVVAVFDGSRPFDEADQVVLDNIGDKAALYVINKSDIADSAFIIPSAAAGHPVIWVSALTGEGIEEMKDEAYALLVPAAVPGGIRGTSSTQAVLVTNVRHRDAVDRAFRAVTEAAGGLDRGDPLEVIALHLRESLDYLGEVIGVVTTEDILGRIFSLFCIGK